MPGQKGPDHPVGRLLGKAEANHGFDAQSGTYVDMVKAGIIDPDQGLYAWRCKALPRYPAFSLITTEAMIADRPGKMLRRCRAAAWTRAATRSGPPHRAK